MARYRLIKTDLNRQYREDLNANFGQIENDITNVEGKIDRVEEEFNESIGEIVGGGFLESLETARDSANAAAINADGKAAYANTQGDYAKAQGVYAKAQGEFANTKGIYADEKAQLASEAAANANQEASGLSGLKVAVVEATQNANIAAEAANIASAKGDYAKEQGEYAKVQGDAIQDIFDQGLVASVNGKTGAVVINANDVGAIPSTEKGVANGVPKLNAQGKVVDADGNEVEGKVKSVNGHEGIVVLTASDVGAETPQGAQSKATDAQNNANSYTDSKIASIPPTDLTPIEQSITNLQSELDTQKNKVASPTELGQIKVGNNLTIRSDGTLDVTGAGGVPFVHTFKVIRLLTTVGLQKVTGLKGRPSLLLVNGSVYGTKILINGNFNITQDYQTCVYTMNDTGNSNMNDTAFICVANNASHFVRGVVEINGDSIDIDWRKTGNGVNHQVTLYITVIYQKEQ